MRTGLTYPLKCVDGSLVTISDYAKLVEQAIIHTINTKVGELVWHPEYGTGYLVLDKTTPEILREIRAALELSLLSYPDVAFKLFASLDDSGMVNLLVVYQCPDVLNGELSFTLK